MESLSLYTDGCCNPKIGACASVTDKNGNDLIGPFSNFLSHFECFNGLTTKTYNNRLVYCIMFTDVSSQQNNGAELVAMIVGLLIALYYNYTTIYCDSQLIIDSWSIKESKIIKDPYKKRLQMYCVELATEFRKRGNIVKIDGGSNPADLGFHRNK